MKLHTSIELAQYCDNLENAKRYGAQFWREGFGVTTKEEARAILPDVLDSYLRPEMRNFAEILIQRFSVSASDARKDASKHVGNAFPTLKGIGIVTRKGPNAKPTKAYAQAGEDHTITVIRDLENGETFSCCIAWQYANAADISDSTEVSPIIIGESRPISEGLDPTMARVVGTDSGRRYDVAYTPEAVSELLAQTVSRYAISLEQVRAIESQWAFTPSRRMVGITLATIANCGDAELAQIVDAILTRQLATTVLAIAEQATTGLAIAEQATTGLAIAEQATTGLAIA